MKRFFSIAALCAEITAAFLLAACDRKNCPPNAPCPTATPAPTTCSNIAGSRNTFWSDSCGQSGAGMMVIAQAGCSFTGTLTGLGTFTGTVAGSNLNYTLTFTNCSGTATGTASISSSLISGTYSGTQSGGGSCCSPVTGSISVQFVPTPPPVTGTPTTVTPTPPTTTVPPTTTPFM